MLVFTHCSCRSSRYGYQYSYFPSDSKEKKQSLLFSELSESNSINAEFIKWCENYNGWQLALWQSSGKEKYLLMVGQLEKSRELEKKIQKKRGVPISNENSLDSDYYMTIGWLGDAEEIKRLTVFLLKEYKKDGYRDLFNRLELTIRKSSDAERYEIDTESFNAIFASIPEVSVVSPNPHNSRTIFLEMMARKVTSSEIYLSCANAQKKQEPLSIRKKNIDKCISIISNFDRLSGKVPLLIAYDYFSVDSKIDIRIDYEYLWFYL